MQKTTIHFLLIAVIALLGFSTSTKAQTDLPVGFSKEEIELMKSPDWHPAVYDDEKSITTPPPGSLRAMAQWEEVQAVTITWTSYTSVLKGIVRALAQDTKVIIVCYHSFDNFGNPIITSDSTTIKNYLLSTANGGALPASSIANCIFDYTEYNSVWARDYGLNSVYMNDVDSLLFVDWKYNRPTRTSDDTVPRSIGRILHTPVYETTQGNNLLINTGGNWMSDGLGTSFHSKLILNENPSWTVPQVDTILKHWMGITRSIKMETLPFDGIHHIDMHMKLLNEETLLVGEYPTGTADGPQIEANLQFVLSNYNSVFGTPYKVVRIPQPPDQNNGYTYPDNGGNYLTYANATIVNKTVIVPQYYTQYDTTALCIWRGAMPGYNVVGINSNTTISASGSLHCITHEIGPSDPLLIVHQNLPNTTNTTTPYQVDARIQHRSGIQTATLYYTNDTSVGFTSTTMTLTNASLNTWTGFIPAYPSGTHVFYYIKGHANSGKEQVRPMPAPAGNFSFYVTGSTGINESGNAVYAMKDAYPNPSHGITCIPVSLDKNMKGSIKLFDMLGNETAVIYEGEMPAGDKNYFINTVNISAGAYFITVETAEGRLTQKLMVR